MKKIIIAVTVLISVGILGAFFAVAGSLDALRLWGETGIGLNWQNFDVPNLARVRAMSNDLLSYDLQVKVKINQEGGADEHYIAGLSFRFDSGSDPKDYDDDNFYGISFFRSGNNAGGVEICHKPDKYNDNSGYGRTLSIPSCAKQAHLDHGDSLGPCSSDSGSTTTLPAWVKALGSSFDPVLDGEPYLVLWLKKGSSFTLLDYRQLVDADGVVSTTSSGYENENDNENDNEDKCNYNVNDNFVFDTLNIRPWSTIMVRVEEVMNGDKRENRITAFVQGPDGLPRNTVSWNEDVFNKVDWNSAGTNTIVDDTLTSIVFETNSKAPAELGLHGFHSGSTNNEQFFCDIDIKLANIIEIIQK